MRILRRIWKTDETSPSTEALHQYDEMKTREARVNELVKKTAQKIEDNHLGPKMHRVLGGLQ